MNRIFILLLVLQLSANAQSTKSIGDDFSRANRFNTTAKTVLAPAYPYLAEFLVNRFQLNEKAGIGIDVGGGPGDLVLELAHRTANFYWINTDINPYFAQYFLPEIKNSDSQRLGFLVADAQQLPFRDDYADLIVSRGSLQFWPDLPRAIAEIVRVLKPGGGAFIGRGFPENMPLEVAKSIREKQRNRVPNYDPAETATELEEIMKELKIKDFEILRPHKEAAISYGVWLIFSKPVK